MGQWYYYQRDNWFTKMEIVQLKWKPANQIVLTWWAEKFHPMLFNLENWNNRMANNTMKQKTDSQNVSLHQWSSAMFVSLALTAFVIWSADSFVLNCFNSSRFFFYHSPFAFTKMVCACCGVYSIECERRINNRFHWFGSCVMVLFLFLIPLIC